MSKNPNLSYGLNNPLQKMNPINILSRRAPTVNDLNYEIGQLWIDTPNDEIYVLTSTAAGAATWIISATGTLFETLTPDTGTSPVVADATNTISVLGGTNIGSVGGASTLTMNLDAAIELDSVECGTNLARISAYTTNLAIIQAFADEDTATGAAVREAIYGNLQVTSGDGNHTPSAIWGSIDVASGSNALQTLGVYGLCTQEDGAVIASTAAGVEGQLSLLETDVADLPATYAFGVKAYLFSDDAAGVPAGIVAGVGSVVEYFTPFNAKAYGVAITRLDAGGGTGTAGAAAIGVIQGTVAAADWDLGIDFATATSGFTTADIQFVNGVLWNSLNATDTYITCPADGRFGIQLGDAAGAEAFEIFSSTPGSVAAISSLGDITGNSVDVVTDVRGRTLFADGDEGTGIASTVGITNDSQGVGAGAGSVKMNGANPADSTGWIKIYVGATAKYIPYWDNATS